MLEMIDEPVRVAHDCGFPRFAEVKDGKSEGLAVDIFRAAAARAGINVKFVPVSFEQRQLTLADGRADAYFRRRRAKTARLTVHFAAHGGCQSPCRRSLILVTNDNHQIYAAWKGLRHGPKEVMDRLYQGEIVDPSLLFPHHALLRDEFRKVRLDEPHLLDRQRLAFCECTNARCFSGVVVDASNVRGTKRTNWAGLIVSVDWGSPEVVGGASNRRF